MKKSLIALAALAVVSAASAQSSVTVYGVADVGMKTQKITNGTDVTKASGVADGAMAGQRFGFKGTEDLGGGLSANFVIEQGISMTSSTLTNFRSSTSMPQTDAAITSTNNGRSSTSLNRQSYVGLSSANLGQVRLGYQYTNVYEVSTLSGFNLGAEGVTGADTVHTFGNAMVGGTRANAVTYITPMISGFSAQLQYGAATGLNQYETTIAADAVGVTKAERTSVLLNYANGPLIAKLAYTNYKNAAATSAVVPLNSALGAQKTGTLTQLGASYDFGVLSVAGTYNNGEDGAAGTANATWKGQQVGVKVPFGPWAFIATTGTAKTTSAALGTINDVKQNQLAVQYSLSKRTTLYAYTGTTKNTGNAAASLDKNTSNVAGINHTF